MNERTCSQRDAAGVIFNLPGYHVLDAVDLPSGGRRVKVRADVVGGDCPSCGTSSMRVHSWTEQRVKDVPAGRLPVQVAVRKARLVCRETSCERRTFTQVSDQLPLRARCFSRLRQAVLDAVITSGRAVDEVARAHRIAWWTVQHTVNAAASVLPNVDQLRVRHLGIDEHRYRSVRYFRDQPGGPWRRVEPWMSTFVNADSGQVLGIIDGRDSASVQSWLDARSRRGGIGCRSWRSTRQRRSARPSPPPCRTRRSAWMPSTWSSWPT